MLKPSFNLMRTIGGYSMTNKIRKGRRINYSYQLKGQLERKEEVTLEFLERTIITVVGAYWRMLMYVCLQR